MGKSKGLYKEEFPAGSMVKIASRSLLEIFLKTWTLHNKLEPSQLNYADQIAEVDSVGFYHGGDELYKLKGIPGIWHEQCLKSVPLPQRWRRAAGSQVFGKRDGKRS